MKILFVLCSLVFFMLQSASAHEVFTASDGKTYIVEVPIDERPIMVPASGTIRIGEQCADEVPTLLFTPRTCTWAGEVTVQNGSLIETLVDGQETISFYREEKFFMILGMLLMVVLSFIRIYEDASEDLIILASAFTVVAVVLMWASDRMSTGMIMIGIVALGAALVLTFIDNARTIPRQFASFALIHLTCAGIPVIWG